MPLSHYHFNNTNSNSFARPCIVIRGLDRFYKETFRKTSNADKVDSTS